MLLWGHFLESAELAPNRQKALMATALPTWLHFVTLTGTEEWSGHPHTPPEVSAGFPAAMGG